MGKGVLAVCFCPGRWLVVGEPCCWVASLFRSTSIQDSGLPLRLHREGATVWADMRLAPANLAPASLAEALGWDTCEVKEPPHLPECPGSLQWGSGVQTAHT